MRGVSHCISENAKCVNIIVFQNAKNSVLDLLKSMSVKSKTFNLCLMIIVLANLNTFLGNRELFLTFCMSNGLFMIAANTVWIYACIAKLAVQNI